MNRPPEPFGRARHAAAHAFIVAALLVAAPRPAEADVIEEAWRRGNEAYLRSDFATAVSAYEQIDRQGVVSPDLYYNLGNAYFRRGQLGPAAWAFERTLAIDPENEDARYNLRQAQKIAGRHGRDRLEGADHDPAWIRIVTAVSPSTLAWVFLSSWSTFFVALGVALVRRRRNDAAAAIHNEEAGLSGLGAAFAGLIALVAGGLLGGRAYLDRVPFAVVLPDEIAVREGADSNYRTAFSVHAALKVRVLDQDHGWIRVRLANGLEGWLPEEAVGRI